MGRTPPDQMQERQERAIALINSRPGITPQSLSLHLGIANTRSDGPLRKLLDWLRSHPEIQIREPDALHETIRLYPADYELPEKRLFQPANKALTECKVYTVPLGELHHYTAQPAVKPVRQKIADIPTTTPWKHKKQSTPLTEQQEKPVKSTSDIRDAIEKALSELISMGTPFLQTDVCNKAGIALSSLHRQKDLRDKVNKASKISRNLKSAAHEEVVADLPTPDPTAELQQQIQELEQRNRELRQQLQQIQEVQPVPTNSLGIQLQGEIDFWYDKIYQYRQQISELEQAIASAQAKVEVLTDLMEREQLQVHASSNGKAIAIGGAKC